MDLDSKFDLKIKKNLHIIYDENYNENQGLKMRNLRLKNNLTLHELSSRIDINETTLRQMELNKIKMPYYYWKTVCNFFDVDHVVYLELCTMKEESIQDKLIKIRALIGAKSWKDVADCLGYSVGFINDLMTRYVPNINHMKIIDSVIEKFK